MRSSSAGSTVSSKSWVRMETPSHLALAERVVSVASELGVESSLIGAAALAVHNFVRATEDVDLGVSIQSFARLRELEERLRAVGLKVRLTLPDEEDDLGGVIRVWDREDADGEPIEPVEIVNFYNFMRPRRHPGIAAVRTAVPISPGASLRVVRLADLIAMKLATGSPWDKLDAVRLLENNPGADADEIRTTCARYGLDATFDDLVVSK